MITVEENCVFRVENPSSILKRTTHSIALSFLVEENCVFRLEYPSSILKHLSLSLHIYKDRLELDVGLVPFGPIYNEYFAFF